MLIQMLLVFRFVDFFIMVCEPEELLSNNVEHILHIFNNSSEGLMFTWELPTNNCIKFLDIRLIFSALGLFFMSFGSICPGHARLLCVMRAHIQSS